MSTTNTAALDPGAWTSSLIRPRVRVVCDNDFAGDPDGLVQLAHLLLCRSADVRGLIGSHYLFPGISSTTTADDGAAKAREVAALCRRGDVLVHAGSNTPMEARDRPIRNDAALAIVEEAMRTDSPLPLYVTCGGSLTSIASAWLIEPRIAQRLTLVWIGGHEHEGLADPPEPGMDMEYNLHLDPIAGQVVFNDSDLAIWQVPRNMYRTVLAGRAELLVRMAGAGRLGRWLWDELANLVARATSSMSRDLGEAYVLGDSPLVSLTALQTSFEPGPASSRWVTLPCPHLAESGLYEPDPAGRPLRVYTDVDPRLILEDLYAKLALHELGLE